MYRILVFSRVQLLAHGLSLILERLPQAVVQAAWGSAQEFESLLHSGQHDLAIVDLDTSKALECMSRNGNSFRCAASVIVIGTPERTRDHQFARSAALGFDASGSDLLAVILRKMTRVANGSRPAAVGTDGDRGQVRTAHPVVLNTLSPREIEVQQLIQLGANNDDIARSLGIQLSTVKVHVHNVLTKLHVKSRTQAAAVGRLTRAPDCWEPQP